METTRPSHYPIPETGVCYFPTLQNWRLCNHSPLGITAAIRSTPETNTKSSYRSNNRNCQHARLIPDYTPLVHPPYKKYAEESHELHGVSLAHACARSCAERNVITAHAPGTTRFRKRFVARKWCPALGAEGVIVRREIRAAVVGGFNTVGDRPVDWYAKAL